MKKRIVGSGSSLQGAFTAMIFLLFSAMVGCSLYLDDENLTDFYEFRDFEILELGKNISDVVLDPAGQFLYLADYGNNAVLRIDVSGAMVVDKALTLGSHPIALDITPDRRTLVVAFNGESNLKLVDLATFTVVDTIFISLVEINDIACATGGRIFISGRTEPTVVSVQLPDKEEYFEIIRSGELLASPDGNKIFVASSNIALKYDVSSGVAIQEAWSAPFEFQAKINHFVMGPKGDQVFLCVTDKNDPTRVQDVVAYSTDNLTYTGKFEIKSAGMAVAVSKDGKRIFVAPAAADPDGIFIVEFDGQTKLEQEYYMVAGDIHARGLVIDHDDRYLYVIVNTPGNNDTYEPYNNRTYDLQRIEIH